MIWGLVCKLLGLHTGVVLVSLLEVIKVDPSAVDVKLVVNDGCLVSESSTKVVLGVLGGSTVNGKKQCKYSFSPYEPDVLLYEGPHGLL